MEPYVFVDGQPMERLDPEDFTVRMIDADDPDHRVLEYPAADPFVPPAGRFRVWLEGPGWMTPFTDLLIAGGSAPRQARRRSMPVVPAGTVLPPEGFEPLDEVRLLFASGDPVAGVTRMELTRRVPLNAWPEGGVRMPEGVVVSTVWRPKDEASVALSRPFKMVAGKEVTPTYSSPKEGTGHVMAYVDRGPGTMPSDARGVELRLASSNQSFAPEVTVPTNWGLYALWFDVPSGATRLLGDNELLRLPPVDVSVGAGRVVRVRGQLIKRDPDSS